MRMIIHRLFLLCSWSLFVTSANADMFEMEKWASQWVTLQRSVHSRATNLSTNLNGTMSTDEESENTQPLQENNGEEYLSNVYFPDLLHLSGSIFVLAIVLSGYNARLAMKRRLASSNVNDRACYLFLFWACIFWVFGCFFWFVPYLIPSVKYLPYFSITFYFARVFQAVAQSLYCLMLIQRFKVVKHFSNYSSIIHRIIIVIVAVLFCIQIGALVAFRICDLLYEYDEIAMREGPIVYDVAMRPGLCTVVESLGEEADRILVIFGFIFTIACEILPGFFLLVFLFKHQRKRSKILISAGQKKGHVRERLIVLKRKLILFVVTITIVCTANLTSFYLSELFPYHEWIAKKDNDSVFSLLYFTISLNQFVNACQFTIQFSYFYVVDKLKAIHENPESEAFWNESLETDGDITKSMDNSNLHSKDDEQPPSFEMNLKEDNVGNKNYCKYCNALKPSISY